MSLRLNAELLKYAYTLITFCAILAVVIHIVRF